LRLAQQSLIPAVEWLEGLIGPGGLLLGFSHLFAVTCFSFMGVGGKGQKRGHV